MSTPLDYGPGPRPEDPDPLDGDDHLIGEFEEGPPASRYLRLPGGRVFPDPEELEDLGWQLRYSDPLDLGALGDDRLFLASVLEAYRAVCLHPPIAAEIRAAKEAP